MTSTQSSESERYRVIRRLGRGGMGEVLLVYDAVREEQVAQKRILARNPGALVRFKREFRVVERLHHPGLVRLFELGEDARSLYFTMEFVPGRSIAAYCAGGADPRTIDRQDPLIPEAKTEDLSVTDGPATFDLNPGGDARIEIPAPVPVAPRADLAKLLHVLPQVLEALAYLHGQGIVHRDLKVSNIVVGDNGTVRLLDFGILGGVGVADRGEVIGTLGFMSPEQIEGAPATPASDLYALGAVLYVLAAGRAVFDGLPAEVLERHRSAPPPRLEDVAPGVPEPLAVLVRDLLSKRPEDRPPIEVVASHHLPALGARPLILSPPRPPAPVLVGREAEQDALRSHLDDIARGGFRLVLVPGPTGCGKSALAHWLSDEAEHRGLRVLRGQGRPSERVAFNAVDGLIDDLALQLVRVTGHAAEVREAMRVAASAFPVLAPTLGKRSDDDQDGTQASRGAAFGAVLTLIRAVAEGTGALLLIDDLQWADADSIACLDDLARDAPPHVCVVATLRDDVGETVAGRWVEAQRDATPLPLPPLASTAVRALLTEVVGARGVQLDEPSLERAAEICDGLPFLAEVVGRSLARNVTAGDSLADRVHCGILLADQARRGESLRERMGLAAIPQSTAPAHAEAPPPLAHEVLALVVAADGWIRAGDLARLLHHTQGEVEDAIAELARDGLVRRSGAVGPEGTVDVYHDTVRTAALEVLGWSRLVHAHGRLADDLMARISARPSHRLVRHLVGAGRDREAARYARVAASQAEARRAYGLAADMYAVAMRLPTDDRLAILRARAEVLHRGARYREAALMWREVAASSEGEAAIDAELREAHALLASNDVTAGYRRLDAALAAAGEPPVGRMGLRDVIAGIAFQLGPRWRRRPPSGVRPDRATRAGAERDVRLGMMVGYFDPLAGVRFLQRARVGFESSGALEQAAWCDYLFAYFALFGTRKSGPVPLMERYRAVAAARVAGLRPDGVEVQVFPPFLDGVAAQRDGRWDDAAASLDLAGDLIERGGDPGTNEHMLILVHRAQVDWFRQDLDAFGRSLGRLRRFAFHADDSATRCHVAFCASAYSLFCGDIEEAVAGLRELDGAWPEDEPTFQRCLVDIGIGAPIIYIESCRGARARVAEALRRYRRFMPLRTMYGGGLATTAALVEATALRSGDPAASARTVDYYASFADRAPPFLTTGALRARAYAADARGRSEAAVRLLLQAEEEARKFGQRVDAAIAAYQRGLRLGGDEGAKLCADAHGQIVEVGSSPRLLHEDIGRR